MKKLLITITLLSMSSCTDSSATRSTLRDAGYTAIHTRGYAWFMCGEDDHYATGFTAKNHVGRSISGAVCCGMLAKGCTIRY